MGKVRTHKDSTPPRAIFFIFFYFIIFWFLGGREKSDHCSLREGLDNKQKKKLVWLDFTVLYSVPKYNINGPF